MSSSASRSAFLFSLLERTVALYIPLLQWFISFLIMISCSWAIFDYHVKFPTRPINPELIILLCASVPYLLWFIQYLRRVYNAPPWYFICTDLVLIALYITPAILLGKRLWKIETDEIIRKLLPDPRLLKGILGLAIGQGVLFLVTAMGRVCLVVEECRKRRRRQERNRLAREAAQKERKLSEVTVGGESTVGDGDGMPVPESPV
jgi:hypothetical protein